MFLIIMTLLSIIFGYFTFIFVIFYLLTIVCKFIFDSILFIINKKEENEIVKNKK
jgi:hypothetical protein